MNTKDFYVKQYTLQSVEIAKLKRLLKDKENLENSSGFISDKPFKPMTLQHSSPYGAEIKQRIKRRNKIKFIAEIIGIIIISIITVIVFLFITGRLKW